MTDIKKDRYRIIQGDCLKVMDKLIEEGVKVDCILTDPPYGTTACKWDTIIPFNDMWERLNKLIKPNGAIVLFGSEPFSSALRMSNVKNYKYDWIWEKEQGTNQFLAKKQPLRKIENISVFYKKQVTYNPQMTIGSSYEVNRVIGCELFGNPKKIKTINEGKRYPVNVLKFNRELSNRYHPTQKPIKLMEYLIKTYTDKNELVLDFTMGSGSTGVACANTNRKFIGIELDDNYFNIAKQRIEEACK